MLEPILALGRTCRGGRMNISLDLPEVAELKPRITVIGIGGAGCNAINNMIATGLDGVEFVAANTDAQALAASNAEHRVQLGAKLTEGLGAGAKPEIGRDAAEEAIDDIREQIEGSHMVFLAAGMGGGTGTGAVSVIARIAREMNILTVAIVSKPFQFEGSRRMRTAEAGIETLRECVDTLIVIPNQNLFRLANDKTTFAEAFILADQVLYSGIACIVDLIVKDGLINLDFADVKAVMKGMGTAMMGTGEATGDNRATLAAEEAISNPLLDEISLQGAQGLLVSIIGGRNLTLFEVDEAASRVKREADPDANIIVGASFEDDMDERIRVSIVASGLPEAKPAHGSGSAGWNSGSINRQPQLSTSQASNAIGGQNVAAGTTTTAQGSASEVDGRLPAGDMAGVTLTDNFDVGSNSVADTGGGLPHQSAEPPQIGSRFADEAYLDAGQGAADPYLGSTPADEFARALSEVIGTVDESSSEESRKDRSDNPEVWTSSDGVTIEDGFEPAMTAPPPPLPVHDTQQLAEPGFPFNPAPPAELPRRVPDISEFPEVVQREYRSKTLPQEESEQRTGGVPGILRRLAGLGRSAHQLADTREAESEQSRSSNPRPHSGENTAYDSENLPDQSRRSGNDR